ncbi:hypothetical protein [Demequina mangrovi]|uniref:Uncharacterized protein n=1 Tax=Demequina mangrovi TaxID=1043493 RepID=A0A1H6XBB8_9MICO|nr:hypothetical protein [Demequina mangrovi]SEJ21825.1 hypothetical protein SAMN05421637_1195 [Demequina mangrovi]
MSDTYDDGTEALKKLAEEVEHERDEGRPEFDIVEEDEAEAVDDEAPADGPLEPLDPDPTEGAPETRYL